MPPPLIPTIGYIRVSLAREEMISPEIQKAAIAAWAAREKRDVVAWIEDLDMSGRNFRRKVISAIERIEAREAREIAVYRYDRWGRNAVESLANIRRVEMVGGRLQSATEPLDAETAIGRYSRTNALALAEMQSDIIGENWRAALDNRVGRGLPGTGTRRFGYVRLGRVLDPLSDPRRPAYRRDPGDTDGERYEPDYDGGTADALTHMYDMYISGSGFRTIVLWTDERGILNARSNPWSITTVGNVLDGGFAAGLLHTHPCKCDKPDACKNWTHVPGAHPAIIDMATWQAYLDARKARAKIGPRARSSGYPEAGLIVCGRCYGNYGATNGRNGQKGYMVRCYRRARTALCAESPYVRRVVVEETILAALARWAADIEGGGVVVAERVRSARGRAESEAARFSRELADKDAALVRLTVARVEDGGVTPAAIWDASRDRLLAERAVIERQLTEASRTASAPDSVTYAPVMASLLDGWPIMTVAERRSLLGQVIRHVTVRGTKGAIELDVTPVWESCGCPRCVD